MLQYCILHVLSIKLRDNLYFSFSIPTPGFPLFLPYVRCISGVTFIRRSSRDEKPGWLSPVVNCDIFLKPHMNRINLLPKCLQPSFQIFFVSSEYRIHFVVFCLYQFTTSSHSTTAMFFKGKLLELTCWKNATEIQDRFQHFSRNTPGNKRDSSLIFSTESSSSLASPTSSRLSRFGIFFLFAVS